MSTERKPQTVGQVIKEIQTGLREMTARLHQLNEAVGSHLDLLAGDLEVLDEIGRQGPLSPRDLVASSGIHPATLTGILDRLERGQWITRSPDPDDRRKVRIAARFDRAGEILRLYGPMNRSIAKLCAGFSPAELEVIRDFLQGVGEAASNAGATARSDE
ncbi:MAG TPA: MarR family transcriptional regulator [Acidimicrobiia bacterium]|nr:MarR family transcriptional regulator [Acidimicrobiia bacterium]